MHYSGRIRTMNVLGFVLGVRVRMLAGLLGWFGLSNQGIQQESSNHAGVRERESTTFCPMLLGQRAYRWRVAVELVRRRRHGGKQASMCLVENVDERDEAAHLVPLPIVSPPKPKGSMVCPGQMRDKPRTLGSAIHCARCQR